MRRHILANDTIYQYLLTSSLRETPLQQQLREFTLKQVEQANMMISPEQGQLLSFLVELIEAKFAIEIGVFTGYGSLAIAKSLANNGKLIACDQSDEWPKIGVPYWEKARVRDKIQLEIAPAGDTLQNLIARNQVNQFDFIFIDADKINYPLYYECSLQLLRPGGMIVMDNVIRIGEVFVWEQNNPAARAVYNLCQKIRQDERVSISMIPIGEGMLLVRKREN